MLVIPARQAADYEHLAYYFYDQLRLHASMLGLELPAWDDLPYAHRRAYELAASEYIPHPCDEDEHLEEITELQTDLDKAAGRSGQFKQILDDFIGGDKEIEEAQDAIVKAQDALALLKGRLKDVRTEMEETEYDEADC